MDNNNFDSKLNKLRNSMDNMPSRTDKSAILQKIERKKNKRSRIMVFGGSVASLMIITLLVLSSLGSVNLNIFGSDLDSGEGPLKLTDAKVEIHSDEDRTGATIIQEGEMKGERIVPTVLEYQFSIKNTGDKKLGTIKWADEEDKNDFNHENGLQFKIEPNNQLKSILEEAMGYNLLNKDNRPKAGLGYGFSGLPRLEAGQEGDYWMTFTLGATKENPQVPLAPSEEKLNELLDAAPNAELVVTVKDEEIARFKLNDYIK
ncbi:hypothetical protein [Virgibacillus doumboii]|uniref:hypothetical protein n=1 Tax=Virgibacillus doumboii TaxID=2697503 RepID=UPI0013DF6F8C|nr:hypothetical protein [Virgibacillus doumboii]